MNPLILISYITVISVSAFIYLFHRNRIKQQKQLIKKVYLEWSTRFNWQFIESWILITILFLHLARSIYLIANSPDKNHGHFALMLLILVLSFYPRWKFSIGANGVLLGINFLRWQDIMNWQVLKNYGKKLKFICQLKDREHHTQKKLVRIPSEYEGEVLRILRQNLSGKELKEGKFLNT